MDKIDKFLIECSSSNSIARLLIRYANREDLIIHFRWNVRLKPSPLIWEFLRNYFELIIQFWSFPPESLQTLLLVARFSSYVAFVKPH